MKTPVRHLPIALLTLAATVALGTAAYANSDLPFAGGNAAPLNIALAAPAALLTNPAAAAKAVPALIVHDLEKLAQPKVVPEPSTWAMMLGGLGLLGLVLRRRARRA